MRSQLRFLFLASLILLGGGVVYILVKAGLEGVRSPTRTYMEKKLQGEAEVLSRRRLTLRDPNEAPNSLRALAEKGYRIMVDTKSYAKDYVGANLNCTNCHFAAGDMAAGSQGGISLVGVAAKYPDYDPKLKQVVDLPVRINSCFVRSMNGKPLPLDSDLMLALVCYLHWISQGQPIYSPIPWLGLKALKTSAPVNPINGKTVYETYCALCHKHDGEGGKSIPPLWGKESFNTSAGMNDPATLAAFIYWNMPYQDLTPVLSEKEAQDVADYILQQARPH